MRAARITLLLEKHSAFGNDDWHVAVYVAFAVLVEEGDGDVCVGYTLDERDAEDAWYYGVFCVDSVSVGMGARATQAGLPRSSSFLAARLLKVLHHEVRSRRAEAGSDAAMAAGWGSPLRRRGVWGFWRVAGMVVGACGSVWARGRQAAAADRGRYGTGPRREREMGGTGGGAGQGQRESGDGAGGRVVGGRVWWAWCWLRCVDAAGWSQAALVAATWAGQEHGG